MLSFACPSCKAVLPAQENQTGSPITCPRCQLSLRVPLPPAATPVGTSPQLTAPAALPVALPAPAAPAGSGFGEQWFYIRDRQKHGPIVAAQLKQLADAGLLQPGDMVLRAGTPKWVSASSVPDLFPAVDVVVPETSPRTWYYTQHREQHGPVSWDELRQRASTRELHPGDSLWQEGMPGWVPASSLEGLFPRADVPSEPLLPREENRSPLGGAPDWTLTRVGLSLVGIAALIELISLLVFILITALVVKTADKGSLVFWFLSLIVLVGGQLLSLVGQALCAAAPRTAHVGGWALASALCIALGALLVIVAALVKSGSGELVGNLGSGAHLAGQLLFGVFLLRVATFCQHESLARRVKKFIFWWTGWSAAMASVLALGLILGVQLIEVGGRRAGIREYIWLGLFAVVVGVGVMLFLDFIKLVFRVRGVLVLPRRGRDERQDMPRRQRIHPQEEPLAE